MPQMAEKTSPDAPLNCAVAPQLTGAPCRGVERRLSMLAESGGACAEGFTLQNGTEICRFRA